MPLLNTAPVQAVESQTGDERDALSGAIPDQMLAKVADLLANALGNGRMFEEYVGCVECQPNVMFAQTVQPLGYRPQSCPTSPMSSRGSPASVWL